MRRYFWTTLLAVAGCVLAPMAAAVDCADVLTGHSDQAVCASPALAKQDARLKALLASRAPSDALAASQAEWIKQRARCNGNVPCLDSAYRTRLVAVQALPAKAAPALRKPKIVIKEFRPDGTLAPIAPVAKAVPAPKVPAMPGDGRSADERLAAAAGAAPYMESATDGWIVPSLARGGIAVLIFLGLLYGLRQWFGRCPSCRKWNRSRVIKVIADRSAGHRTSARPEVRGAARAQGASPMALPPIISKRVYVCGGCQTCWEPGARAEVAENA